MQDRIKYLDVAKFIGIFCIFLGHFGRAAGFAYEFVFTFHVALFFFLSGCTESLSAEIPWYKYLLKNIKNILVPCYLFAIISVVLQCIFTNTYTGILQNLLNILKGCIRNHFIAGSLWFLTCLFVIKIVFYALRKLLKFKALILLVCLGLYLFAQLIIKPRPILTPHMLYNIDSACHYIIFYALGYCCFKVIHSVLELNSTTKKVICSVIGLISFLFSAILFFGKNIFYYLGNGTLIFLIHCLFSPIIIIVLVLIVSKLLENVNLFIELGRNTLFLCGTEYIVKLLVPICFQIIDLEIIVPNPIAAYIYTFALLMLCYKVLIPVEKELFKKLQLIK